MKSTFSAVVSFWSFRFGVSGLSSCRNCKRYHHKLSILTQYLSADKSDLTRKCLETQENGDKIQGVHVGFNLITFFHPGSHGPK